MGEKTKPSKTIDKGYITGIPWLGPGIQSTNMRTINIFRGPISDHDTIFKRNAKKKSVLFTDPLQVSNLLNGGLGKEERACSNTGHGENFFHGYKWWIMKNKRIGPWSKFKASHESKKMWYCHPKSPLVAATKIDVTIHQPAWQKPD
jgi:hypothetical protein